ncbi:hypothetical protein PIB30_088161, partial [Stylosanthes scabra]|nr:hypothetical protein [Stylosanthes scabra]
MLTPITTVSALPSHPPPPSVSCDGLTGFLKGRAYLLSNIRSSFGENGAKGNSPDLYHNADRLTHFLARTVECEVLALARFVNGHFKVLVVSDDFASDDDGLDIPNTDI